MTQDEVLVDQNADSSLQASLQTISDIIKICSQSVELTNVAVSRLNEIYVLYDHPNEADTIPSNKSRAQRDIEDHIMLRRKMQMPIKPTSVVYRDIASFLSKKHELAFDPKATKKKKDLFRWFDEHWIQIKDQFFILLDNHQLAQTTKPKD